MRLGLALCGALVLVAGCSDSKKPSNGNFEKAIDAYLDKNPLCIGAPYSSTRPAGQQQAGDSFPAYVALPLNPNGQSMFDSEAKPFEALAKVGLVTGRATVIDVASFFGPARKTQVKEYSLTDAGKQAMAKAAGTAASAGRFCYGTPVVNEVTQFTEPSAAFGATVSSVAYTFKLKDRASWSSDPAMQDAFPALKQTAGDSNEAKTEVVLTNNGWVDTRGSKL